MTLAQLLERTVADSSDREAWKAHRVGRIGSSNAAAFAKTDPVAIEKYTAALIRGSDWVGNVHSDRGNFWEPNALAAEGFEQNTRMFRAVDDDRFVATPDGVRETETGLLIAETKATQHAKLNADGLLSVPRAHYRQTQWQMFVAGPDALLAKYIVVPLGPDGMAVRMMPLTRSVPRDETAIAELVFIATKVAAGLRAAERFRMDTPS